MLCARACKAVWQFCLCTAQCQTVSCSACKHAIKRKQSTARVNAICHTVRSASNMDSSVCTAARAFSSASVATSTGLTCAAHTRYLATAWFILTSIQGRSHYSRVFHDEQQLQATTKWP